MQLTDVLRTYPGQILGFRADGRPIRTIAGGAPDGDESDGDAGQSGGQSDDSAGDSGQQASDVGQGAASSTDSKIGDAWDGKIESLPVDAQKLIDRYKNEAANASSKSRENARKEAEQELLKKLGLVKGDDKPDPEKLANDLAAARDAQRQTAVELAVFRGASKHQGDPSALLDSRSFLAKVSDLDPSANDFAAKVETAIKDAVKDNPKLLAARAAGQSSVDHSGGAGERRTGEPKSLTDAVANSYGT